MRRRSQAAADPMGDLQTEGAGPSTPLLGSELKLGAPFEQRVIDPLPINKSNINNDKPSHVTPVVPPRRTPLKTRSSGNRIPYPTPVSKSPTTRPSGEFPPAWASDGSLSAYGEYTRLRRGTTSDGSTSYAPSLRQNESTPEPDLETSSSAFEEWLQSEMRFIPTCEGVEAVRPITSIESIEKRAMEAGFTVARSDIVNAIQATFPDVLVVTRSTQRYHTSEPVSFGGLGFRNDTPDAVTLMTPPSLEMSREALPSPPFRSLLGLSSHQTPSASLGFVDESDLDQKIDGLEGLATLSAAAENSPDRTTISLPAADEAIPELANTIDPSQDVDMPNNDRGSSEIRDGSDFDDNSSEATDAAQLLMAVVASAGTRSSGRTRRPAQAPVEPIGKAKRKTAGKKTSTAGSTPAKSDGATVEKKPKLDLHKLKPAKSGSRPGWDCCPSSTHVATIVLVLLEAGGCLRVDPIYAALHQRFPYYRDHLTAEQSAGLRNTVRHNLSANRDTFLLTEDPPSGTPSGPAATTRKGGYWSLQPGVSLETKEGANGETIWSVKK